MNNLNTIGALIANKCGMALYCNNLDCRHSAMADLRAMAAKLGEDHGAMYRDIAPKLRCSACGGKDVSIRLSPYTGNTGKYPSYGK